MASNFYSGFSMTTHAVHTLHLESSLLSTVDHSAELIGLRSHSHASADAFLATADLSAAGCVVTNLQMPGRTGYGIQRRLLEADSPLAVIFIAATPSVSQTVLAVRSGAVTVVEVPLTSQQLSVEIQEGLRISEKRREHILKVKDARSRVATLTQRERDTLPGVLRGKTNDAVAHDLSVSTRTIERRRRSILERLGVDCFAEVVSLLEMAGQPIFPFLEDRQVGEAAGRAHPEKEPGGTPSTPRQFFRSEPFPLANWQTGATMTAAPARSEFMMTGREQDPGRLI
jgi:two-component system, LuxR family, response regulator TtrR